MSTSVCFLGLALPVVAVVAHVLRVMLLVSVRAVQDLSALSLERRDLDWARLVSLRARALLDFIKRVVFVRMS